MDITRSLPKLSPPLEKGSQAGKLKEAAQAFEGYFVYMLFREMQKTTPQGSLFGSGPGGGIYEHLFHQAMADKMVSGSNGLGLTSFLMKALQKRESGANRENLPSEGLPLKKQEGMPFRNVFFSETVQHLNLLQELTDKSSGGQNKIGFARI